jgi:hypothetical protein
LVSLARLHAKYLDNTMKHLQFRLNQEYESSTDRKLKFYGETKNEIINNYKCDNIMTDFQFNWNWFSRFKL